LVSCLILATTSARVLVTRTRGGTEIVDLVIFSNSLLYPTTHTTQPTCKQAFLLLAALPMLCDCTWGAVQAAVVTAVIFLGKLPEFFVGGLVAVLLAV
jgi:hypothetical protein